MKFRSTVIFFVVHLVASLASMPLFYSAIDKLYRSIGQASANISLTEGVGTLLFQALTFPLLILRQQEYSVFSFDDSLSAALPALLRLVANSIFYVFIASCFTLAWKAARHRGHANA